MQAFIMAAGYGTRLEPLTLAVPKPLVLLGNKPAMQHNIELLRFYGFKEITANIHYHPEQIQNYFGDGDDFSVNLNYSYEEKLLGTAGGVWRMAKIINNVKETFVVLSSDALTDINLNKIIAFHKKKQALVTIGLSPVEEVNQFGVVILDENQRITKFQEKPKKEEALSNLVNAGIYVIEPEVLAMIPADSFYDFGKQLFPKLAESGEGIFGYAMTEYWSDVGTLKQYHLANKDIITGKVKVRIPGRRVKKNLWLKRGTKFDKGTKLAGAAIIGASCSIGKNVKIKGHTSISDMCIIDDEVELENAIIWQDVYIGKGTKIKNSIIGAWCHLDSNVIIEDNVVISNRSRIQSGTTFTAETKILPDTSI